MYMKLFGRPIGPDSSVSPLAWRQEIDQLEQKCKAMSATGGILLLEHQENEIQTMQLILTGLYQRLKSHHSGVSLRDEYIGGAERLDTGKTILVPFPGSLAVLSPGDAWQGKTIIAPGSLASWERIALSMPIEVHSITLSTENSFEAAYQQMKMHFREVSPLAQKAFVLLTLFEALGVSLPYFVLSKALKISEDDLDEIVLECDGLLFPIETRADELFVTTLGQGFAKRFVRKLTLENQCRGYVKVLSTLDTKSPMERRIMANTIGALLEHGKRRIGQSILRMTGGEFLPWSKEENLVYSFAHILSGYRLFQESANLFDYGIKTYGNSQNLWQGKMELYSSWVKISSKQYSKANSFYQEAKDRWPSNNNLSLAWSRIEMMAGHFDRATTTLQSIPNLGPTSSVGLGANLLRLALEYTKGLQKRVLPLQAGIFNALIPPVVGGVCGFAANGIRQGVNKVLHAQTLSDKMDFLETVGLVSLSEHRYQDSKESYLSMQSQYSSSSKWLLGLAQISTQEGSFEEGLTYINTLLEKDPENPDGLLQKIRLLLAALEKGYSTRRVAKEAKKTLLMLKEVDPENATNYPEYQQLSKKYL